MADIATAVISGTFAVVGSLGSVWLKDYLERRRHVSSMRPIAPDTEPPVAYSAPSVNSQAASVRPDQSERKVGAPRISRESRLSSLRPVLLALFGFGVGTLGYVLYEKLVDLLPGADTDFMSFFGFAALLAVAVVASIVYHVRPGPGRGLVFFELETLSLWAAYAFAWSVSYGHVFSELVWATLVMWLISAFAGLLIPLRRRNLEAHANI